jgi:hypothetical protein
VTEPSNVVTYARGPLMIGAEMMSAATSVSHIGSRVRRSNAPRKCFPRPGHTINTRPSSAAGWANSGSPSHFSQSSVARAMSTASSVQLSVFRNATPPVTSRP